MMELKPHPHKSSHVHSFAFEGDARGFLHIQFKDKSGNPTTCGYYEDVPRNLANSFEASTSPGSFIQSQLKPYFKWTVEESMRNAAQDEGVGCGCIDGMAR